MLPPSDCLANLLKNNDSSYGTLSSAFRKTYKRAARKRTKLKTIRRVRRPRRTNSPQANNVKMDDVGIVRYKLKTNRRDIPCGCPLKHIKSSETPWTAFPTVPISTTHNNRRRKCLDCSNLCCAWFPHISFRIFA